jgi:hypothetical protein
MSSESKIEKTIAKVTDLEEIKQDFKNCLDDFKVIVDDKAFASQDLEKAFKRISDLKSKLVNVMKAQEFKSKAIDTITSFFTQHVTPKFPTLKMDKTKVIDTSYSSGNPGHETWKYSYCDDRVKINYLSRVTSYLGDTDRFIDVFVSVDNTTIYNIEKY